jgi:predicted unusual protein kinase regulating ubiquinone biosynthesis (AarF/ABC1/UbiB family)
LLRARLISQTSTADEAASACIDLLVTTGVAHGDPHPGNVFQGAGGFEVLDCERSFLIEKNLQFEMTRSIQTFANSPKSRINLLNEFRNQGLERTRHRFLRLASQILTGSRDISTLGIIELLLIFQNKN